MKIIQSNLKKGKYYDETQPKRIIVLHHTAGGSAQSSIDWWNQNTNKVATAYVIDRDGTILQTFPDDKWASALGIKQAVFNKYGVSNINTRLDQISVQIEIANWGQLILKNGKYYNYVGREVPAEDVQKYDKPYKGEVYYEKYTDAQIKALEELILTLNNKYPSIKLDYNEDMWDVSKRALVGTWGIWSHTSFRSDKNDCHPQPNLIKMLKELKK